MFLATKGSAIDSRLCRLLDDVSEGMRKPGCDVSSPQTSVAWVPSEAVQGHSFKQWATYTIINSAVGFLEDRGCSNEPTSFRPSPGLVDRTTCPF